MPFDRRNAGDGSSGDWKKPGNQNPKSRGQQQKGQENSGWGEQQDKEKGGWQKVGGQQQKPQGSQEWGGQQGGNRNNKAMDNPNAAGSQPRSNASSGSSGGWQKPVGQQQKSQEWSSQQGKQQERGQLTHLNPNGSSGSSSGWQKPVGEQQKSQGWSSQQGKQQDRGHGTQLSSNASSGSSGGWQKPVGQQQNSQEWSSQQGRQQDRGRGTQLNSNASSGSSGGWQKPVGQQQNSQGRSSQQGRQQDRGQQKAEGSQQQRSQGPQGWGGQQGQQYNKTMDKPKAGGSQLSANSSSGSKGEWQKPVGQRQNSQGWSSQQERQQERGQQKAEESQQQKSHGPQGWGGQRDRQQYCRQDQVQQQQRAQGQKQEQRNNYPLSTSSSGSSSGLQTVGSQQQESQEQQKEQQQEVPVQPRVPVPKEEGSPAGGSLSSHPAGIIKRGTIGSPGQVAVNYLDINMEKMPERAFHYDVKIEPDRPKKFWRQAFEQYRVNQLGGAIAAFDGRASCYSVDKLIAKSSNGEVTVVDRYGRTLRFTVEVKETCDLEVDLNSLRNYMSERIFDKPMRAIQCLEVVMAAPCHTKAIRSGRSFFKMSEPGQHRELEDGYEALVGLYQAFMLGDRPFLNVDISHKSFPIGMSVIDYLEHYGLRQKIDEYTDLEYKRRFIESFLKGLNVVYTPPKSFGKAARCLKVNGLSKDPARTQTFKLDGKVLTIADYYKGRNYNIKYPQLHCLHIGPPLQNILVPIELCQIEAGQNLNRKDNVNQVANMIKFAATSTNERKAKIIDLMKFFKHNSDPTISRFGIRIVNDFITVHTRTLAPPQVEYQGKKCCQVRNGSWRMENVRFLETKPLAQKWVILYHDPPHGRKMHYNVVADFEQIVLSQSKCLSVRLETKAEIRTYRDDRSLDNCFGDLHRRCDLAFVIMPQSGVSYDTIKQKAELQHGILTQCIKQFTVERKLNPQTVGNILLKVNSKLNGINHKLRDDPRLPMLKNAMFLGADVSHPSPDQREIPSVVGVAASHDPFGGSYNMQYRLQRSALEEIEDMESITLEHLRVYQRYRNAYPDHILYYRDGVSEGQFPKIKNEELRGIKAACRTLGIRPQICCVIVVKRHHTRFFPKGQPTTYNKFNNVEPGTVVDRTIVHPNEMQFFMVSHQSIQGTAKPTRYNVIENTGRLDIDLLQQLTFNLCHLFPRCTRSVSYPAPAYLAHLVAARGRHYLTGTERFPDIEKEYNKRRIVPEFMTSNPMFFV